jgi:dipeptide/tripeptide permease
MDIFAWILGIILAAAFGLGGLIKLADRDRMRDHFGYSKRKYQLVGLSEIAGAAGIVVGLAFRKIEWIAVAAGIGICCLMVGAMLAHASVEDEGKKVIPAVVMMVLAIVFMIVVSLR